MILPQILSIFLTLVLCVLTTVAILAFVQKYKSAKTEDSSQEEPHQEDSPYRGVAMIYGWSVTYDPKRGYIVKHWLTKHEVACFETAPQAKKLMLELADELPGLGRDVQFTPDTHAGRMVASIAARFRNNG